MPEFAVIPTQNSKRKAKNMKKNILLGVAFAALVASCSQKAKTDTQVGVYTMDQAVMTNGTTETAYKASEGHTQIKIYTPGAYFFIAQSKDSSAGFGVGTYTQEGNKIVETNIFNTNTLDTAQQVGLDITKSEKGYSQIIPEMMIGGNKISIKEDYTAIAASGSSALDGVWHQTKNLVINGKDSADQTYNEYKVYQSGHFMWGAKYLTDTASKTYKNIVGHGTFTLNNDALTESLEMANVSGITGKYNIIVKFNGADEYTQQTADTSTHVVGLKTYKRVSK